MDAPQVELLSALATLLEAGKFSDLTIKCGTKSYAVHRALLASRSGFFDGACSRQFKEAETGIIDLSEDDPEAVEHMIHYFYHLDYLAGTQTPAASAHMRARAPSIPPRQPRKLNLAFVEDPLLAQAATGNVTYNPHAGSAMSLSPIDIRPSSPINQKMPPTPLTPINEKFGAQHDYFGEQAGAVKEESHLVLHTKMYALADKYGITGLKSLSRHKFAASLARHSSSDELPDAIDEVYENTMDSDRGLRDIIIQLFRERPEIGHRSDIEEVIKANPSLAYELWRVAQGRPAY